MTYSYSHIAQPTILESFSNTRTTMPHYTKILIRICPSEPHYSVLSFKKGKKKKKKTSVTFFTILIQVLKASDYQLIYTVLGCGYLCKGVWLWNEIPHTSVLKWSLLRVQPTLQRFPYQAAASVVPSHVADLCDWAGDTTLADTRQPSRNLVTFWTHG